MANFSEPEKQLLEYIPEKDMLRTNLALLREATENIWSVDAPRIIQDYTDHGINHCERIAEYAIRLLGASQGKKLTNEEAYLLLAGIYLHDIGMQCDVVRFPEIKDKAINLGAKFEIKKFTADRANAYSPKEMKDIRTNHHWLSIAWIDIARESPKNTLNAAASGIPRNLVRDLKDVCVHHSKLPISGCDISFTLDTTGRKQYVASLLRLADELDIESNRVNIDTVKTFSLSPANSVYWWLHNQTKITFPKRNLVNVSLILHPDDYTEFAKPVQDAFITEFRTKNSPVLSVLAQNETPVVIDDGSKVIEYEEAERLPEEIRNVLSPAQKTLKDPIVDLSDEVRLWLRAIQFEVGEEPTIDGDTAEMTAALDSGPYKQNVMVRCIGRNIKVSDVTQLDEALTRKVNQGWLISDRSVSEEVRGAVAGTYVKVYKLSEFLDQRVWGPYIRALTSLVEKDRIPELYVDIGCYRQPFSESDDEKKREKYRSLDAAIDEWLGARDKMHVSLLGEFGSGKTWFCRHYAYRQLKKYLKNPAKERLPLLITLRNFTKASTAKELITNAIVDQYQLSFVGDPYDIFDELNRRGKILLILDGFDEMARRVDKQTMVDNFWELAELVEDSSKVILTSRTEYFRWAKEAESVLGGEELGRHIVTLQPPKFDVLYLESFTDKQIRTVIKGRLGVQGKKTADKLLGIENLKEMAKKPVLVELLIAAAEEAETESLTNQAAVYLYATNKLLLRNITQQRTFTSTSDKLLFLCELAWYMIENGVQRIHYKDIPDRIRQHFADRIQTSADLDHWDFDLRNQTLLRPDLQGFYEFSHKSLSEFFVAFKFISELGWLSPPFTGTYEEEGCNICRIPFDKLENSSLAATFGAKSIVSGDLMAIRIFMSQMITDKTKPLQRFRRLKNQEKLRYMVPNIATVLSDKGYLSEVKDLTNYDLGSSVLRTSQLRDKPLNGSVLSNATIYTDDIDKGIHGIIGTGSVYGVPTILNYNPRGSGYFIKFNKEFLTWLKVFLAIAGYRKELIMILANKIVNDAMAKIHENISPSAILIETDSYPPYFNWIEILTILGHSVDLSLKKDANNIDLRVIRTIFSRTSYDLKTVYKKVSTELEKHQLQKDRKPRQDSFIFTKKKIRQT